MSAVSIRHQKEVDTHHNAEAALEVRQLTIHVWGFTNIMYTMTAWAAAEGGNNVGSTQRSVLIVKPNTLLALATKQ